MATEYPIIFNTPMVRAVRDGKKTVTRRPVEGGFECHGKDFDHVERHADASLGLQAYFRVEDCRLFGNGCGWMLGGIRCPFGGPGDRLWVRETWAENVRGCEDQGGYSYRADHLHLEGDGPEPIMWRPSIHMPRRAARLILEIEDVGVERLQAISEEDAWKEGIDELDGRFDAAGLCATAKKYELMVEDAKATFAHFWDGLYRLPEKKWGANPWVWVVRFRLAE